MQRTRDEKSAKSNRIKSSLTALTRAAVLTTTLLFSSPSAQAGSITVTPKKSIRERVELVRQTLKQKVDEKTARSQLSFSERSLTQQWNNWGNWGNWNNWLNWNNWNNWRNWGNWGNWGNF